LGLITDGRQSVQVWYGIVEFNVPLDTVQVILETGGADIGSGHYLLIADLRLKLKKLVGQCSRRILDMDTFGSEEMKEQFELKLQNSFSALDHLKSDEESFQMKSGQHRKKCMWRPQ